VSPLLPPRWPHTNGEALEAGIARQLAILDAAINGTCESSAEVLGIPAGMLAQELTRRLVQEILTRGAEVGHWRRWRTS
jgi:hypothetical protein